MHQEREFSAAAKNSGLPGKFHWSLYGIYFGEREGGMFGFFFFLLTRVSWFCISSCNLEGREELPCKEH